MKIYGSRTEDEGEKSVIITQVVRYFLAGAISFGADFFIFNLLMHKVHYQIANYSGLLVGLAVNYSLSKRWVFNGKREVDQKEVFTFILVTIFGFAFTGLNMFIGIDRMKLDENITKFIVAVLVFVMNFMARKYVIFRDRAVVRE